MSRTDLHKLRMGSSKIISLVLSENLCSSSSLCKKEEERRLLPKGNSAGLKCLSWALVEKDSSHPLSLLFP